MITLCIGNVFFNFRVRHIYIGEMKTYPCTSVNAGPLPENLANAHPVGGGGSTGGSSFWGRPPSSFPFCLGCLWALSGLTIMFETVHFS